MTTIYANGTQDFAVAATFKIAVTSYASIKIFQDTGYPNLPSVWKLIYTTADGETYTSSAFSTATTLRIEAGPADVFYDLGTDPSIATPVAAISGSADPFPLAGLSTTQGGAVTLTGGTSSTSANAGGASSVIGGEAGATGVGGAVALTGGDGGATSGAGGAAAVTGGDGALGDSAGGAASVTGGAGSATNAAGGASSVTGGAGAGTGNGGAASSAGGVPGLTGAGGDASITGGIGGATSGSGGDASVTGGAGTNGNAHGGSVILTGGAKDGSGLDGGVFNRGTSQFRKQAAQIDKADGAQSVTGAQIINGICVHTVTTGHTLTTPTGANILAACPADIATGDSFDFTLITVGTGSDDISTLTAGDGDVTFIGDVTVGPDLAGTGDDHGTWRFRYGGSNAFIGYRL